MYTSGCSQSLFIHYNMQFPKIQSVTLATEWIWAVREEVTEADTSPYKITEFSGGIYAAAVSVDGDRESNSKVRSKMEKWLEGTNFILDNDRPSMGHMIYVDDEIRQGLGYHQMNLYAPVRLRQ